MTRELEIKLEMLRTLDRSGSYLLPEPTLFNHVRLLIQPPPTDGQLKEALNELNSRRLVISAPGALGGPLRWRLSDEGAAELRNQTRV